MNLFLPLRLTVFIHKLMVNNFLDSCSGEAWIFAFGINGGWGGRTTAALLISSVKTQQIPYYLQGWPN
jgi:hypothetical protein